MNTTIFRTLTEADLTSLIKNSIKEQMDIYYSDEKLMKPGNNMLSMAEVIKMLGISKPTLIKWTRKGVVKATKIGRRVFYKREDVDNSLKDYNDREMRINGLGTFQAERRWKGAV